MREYPLPLFALSLVFLTMCVTGGPQDAAALNRDETRISDLRTLMNFDLCQREDNGHCGIAPRSIDPYTDVAYMKKTAPERWCAVLERPDEPREAVTDGCISETPYQ